MDSEIEEIWAIGRDRQKLSNLVSEYGTKIKIIQLDLSNKNSFNILTNLLRTGNYEVKYLINNAGFAKIGSYNDIDINKSLNMIDLNISAVVATTLVAIRYMKENSHIINIASQSAFQPLPYLNIYASTKAFVRNYTRALNVELKNKKISAIAVCPGWIETPLLEKMKNNSRNDFIKTKPLTTANKVAKKALKDAKKNKDISVPTLYVKIAHVISKILPQKWMMKIWLKQQNKK